MLADHDTDVMDATRPFWADDTRARTSPFSPARARPHRILVADDEYLIACDLAFTVTSLGFSVIGPASDGYAALERARRELPDLAVLDIRLPRLDGLAAAKELTETFDIPCIILTGYSEPDFVDAASAIGVSEYLTKPVSPEQLENAIHLTWRRFCRRTQERHDRRLGCNRIEERRMFDRATGVLVESCGISEDEARRLLRDCPRDSRRSIASLAEEIVRSRAFGR
jgi:response regulator NasT